MVRVAREITRCHIKENKFKFYTINNNHDVINIQQYCTLFRNAVGGSLTVKPTNQYKAMF